MKIKELFSEVLPIIAKFAPSVGAALGGPVGAAAGYVIPVLANVFGAHPADIKDLVNKIMADPNAQDKLQMIESNHSDFIGSLTNSLENLTNAKINIEFTWAPQLPQT